MFPLKLNAKLVLQMQACTYEEFLDSLSRQPVLSGQAAMLQMRRQETRLDPEAQLFLATYPDTVHWLALVAEDAPETAVLLPVLDRLAAAAVQIDLRILCEDNGEFSISRALWEDAIPDWVDDPDLPLLLMFDDDWQLQ